MKVRIRATKKQLESYLHEDSVSILLSGRVFEVEERHPEIGKVSILIEDFKQELLLCDHVEYV